MCILTADIGGTNIKLGVIKAGRLVARTVIPAEPQCGLAAALPRMETAWLDLSREEELHANDFTAIGLAFPGLIDPRNGKIVSAPAGKFDDAKSLDLKAWANQQFGLKLTIANDANAALAAEWRYGSARGYRSVVMVTLGTGIGTSVIIEGVPLRGEHGQAGNLGGHFVQSTDGKPCPCGNIGCSESEASSWAVALMAKADAAFSESVLNKAVQVDLAAVFRLATEGDALAMRLREHCLKTWSGLAVSLVHAYDPELLVFGGGVMQSAAIILPAVQDVLDRHAWTPWGKVKAVTALLDNDAGMLGVGYLAEQSSRHAPHDVRSSYAIPNQNPPEA